MIEEEKRIAKIFKDLDEYMHAGYDYIYNAEIHIDELENTYQVITNYQIFTPKTFNNLVDAIQYIKDINNIDDKKFRYYDYVFDNNIINIKAYCHQFHKIKKEGNK